MKFTLSWLKDHLTTDANLDEICDKLNMIGLEVEDVFDPSEIYKDFTICEISSIKKHPDADKLLVCQINDGQKAPRQIVCGANNFSEGDKVPLALPGASINGFEIKEAKLRGIKSAGMLCSQSELGGQDSDGLWILPKESKIGAYVNEIYPSVCL